jgi:hypothetical protein
MATDYVVAAASSGGAVLLGGRQVKAVYIMVYTDRWMENYYWRPLADINSQRRAKPEAMAGFVVIVERTAPAPPKASPVNDPQPKPYVPALPAPLRLRRPLLKHGQHQLVNQHQLLEPADISESTNP